MTNTTACDHCPNPALYNLSTSTPGVRAHLCTLHAVARKAA